MRESRRSKASTFTVVLCIHSCRVFVSCLAALFNLLTHSQHFLSFSLSYPPPPTQLKSGQRLVQWEGMDDEEAPYLMKEFHEHLGK